MSEPWFESDQPLFAHLGNDKADEMRKAFETFDSANPEVWRYYVQFVREAMAAGCTALGSKMIVERIRWQIMLATKSSDGYKINNNFTAFYARKFMMQYPEFGHIFRTRKAVADDVSG